MQLKKFIKIFLPRKLFESIRVAFYPEKINVLEDRLRSIFLTQYSDLNAVDNGQKTLFRNSEFKVYSKHGGDGILAFIFSKIGTTNRTFIEIGVEDGTECNTANLSLNFGWNGLMIDANDKWVAAARSLFSSKLGEKATKVKIVNSFINAENINQAFTMAGIKGDIDLLSIDIDSNDYWVWKSVSVVNPRVVVMEYNSAFGLNSFTIRYDPDFHYQKSYQKSPLYFGASLSAINKLAKEKGYTLVACDLHGHDAFFVRKDIATGIFKESSPEEAFYVNPYTLDKFGAAEKQFDLIKHLGIERI